MGKLHLLFTKEELDETKIEGKIAVVFDVLLATSTITLGLHMGAKEVIPVLHGEEAKQVSSQLAPDSFLLVGEKEGIALEGFHDPISFRSNEQVEGKTVILSTTNGTVAIRKAKSAKQVYMGCLLNGLAVARKLQREHQGETVVLVCSGSSGAFCLEDFYGAGYVITSLVSMGDGEWSLTDAAEAARLFYLGNAANSYHVLQTSSIGQMIQEQGFPEEIEAVSQRGVISLVPYLEGNHIRAGVL